MSSQISLCRTQDKRVSKLLKDETVELCVMKSHIRKQSLRKLLFSYYLRIFPFSPWTPKGSQISLCRFHERVLANYFLRTKLYLCEWNSQITKKFLKSFFHVLNWWYFLYQRRPQCDPKKSFSGSSETVIMVSCRKHKCNSVRWIHTSPRSFLRKILSSFQLRIFPLSP